MQSQSWLGSVGLACLVIGGLLSALILAVLVIAGLKIRRFLAQLSSGGLPPPRITLNRESHIDWKHEEEVQTATAQLQEAGFQTVGDYSINEMPDVHLRGMVNPATGIAAIVYSHQSVGPWIDVCAKYADGSALTVSNAPTGDELDTMPGRKKIWRKAAPLQELLVLFNENLEPKELTHQSAETFANWFEQTYEEEMVWRLKRGGPTAEEIRRIAENMPEQFTDEQLAEAERTISSQSALQLADLCRESFARSTTIPKHEWAELYEHTVIIHDQMPSTVVREIFAEHADLEYNDLPLTAADTGRSVFDELNRLTAGGPFFNKLGDVSEPVVADVWVPRERKAEQE